MCQHRLVLRRKGSSGANKHRVDGGYRMYCLYCLYCSWLVVVVQSGLVVGEVRSAMALVRAVPLAQGVALVWAVPLAQGVAPPPLLMAGKLRLLVTPARVQLRPPLPPCLLMAGERVRPRGRRCRRTVRWGRRRQIPTALPAGRAVDLLAHHLAAALLPCGSRRHGVG